MDDGFDDEAVSEALMEEEAEELKVEEFVDEDVEVKTSDDVFKLMFVFQLKIDEKFFGMQYVLFGIEKKYV